jgi:hypothetical protein
LIDAAALRSWCLARPGVTEELPFGPITTVFKVEGKVFALSALDRTPLEISLKCEPGLAEALRRRTCGGIRETSEEMRRIIERVQSLSKRPAGDEQQDQSIALEHICASDAFRIRASHPPMTSHGRAERVARDHEPDQLSPRYHLSVGGLE